MASSTDAPSPQLQEFIAKSTEMMKLQQTVAVITETCFDTCVPGAPGRNLSGREQACLSNCARRYLETTQMLMQYLESKASRSAAGSGAFS